MTIASNELIELFAKEDKAQLDSNGVRILTADDCFVLASRAIDVGMILSGECPLVPFGDNLVVRVVHETNRKSAGGVDLLDSDAPQVAEAALRGIVLAIGPKVGKPESYKVDDELVQAFWNDWWAQDRLTSGRPEIPGMNDHQKSMTRFALQAALDYALKNPELIRVPKPGDFVVFTRHAGIETVVGDKRYLTMKLNYALAKIVTGAQEEARRA